MAVVGGAKLLRFVDLELKKEKRKLAGCEGEKISRKINESVKTGRAEKSNGEEEEEEEPRGET